MIVIVETVLFFSIKKSGRQGNALVSNFDLMMII